MPKYELINNHIPPPSYLRVVEPSFTGLHCTLATPEAITALHTGSLDWRVGVSIRSKTDQSEASMVVTTETGRVITLLKAFEALCFSETVFSEEVL